MSIRKSPESIATHKVRQHKVGAVVIPAIFTKAAEGARTIRQRGVDAVLNGIIKGLDVIFDAKNMPDMPAIAPEDVSAVEDTQII